MFPHQPHSVRMCLLTSWPPTTRALVAVPHHTQLPACSLVFAAPPQEYQELVAQFKRQEQQLYQFCEEKVTLAHHAADLIQQHQKELEAVRMCTNCYTGLHVELCKGCVGRLGGLEACPGAKPRPASSTLKQ